MPYYPFLSMHQLLGRQVAGSPQQFYNDLQRIAESYVRAGHKQGAVEHNRAWAEASWFECGCPYYKVDNASIEMFRSINIDLPFKYLRLPYQAFVIQFADDNPLLTQRGPIRSCLVTKHDADDESPRFFCWVDCGEQEPTPPYPPVLNYVQCLADDERIIGQEIHALPVSATGSDLADNDLETVVVRIAVSVAFLATSSDKMIRPDVLSRDLAAWLEAARKGDLDRQRVIRERAVRRGKLGFVVDGEREYLHHRSAGGENGSGHELSHRHVRSAHFRRLPTGVVTFVRQAIVRPDLPARSG